MKLLSSSGLLYSAVSASATVDGHYGVFPEIDWAVTIAESATTVATQTAGLSSSGNVITGTPALGWDPSVSVVVACWDGGKVLGGWGYQGGMLTKGWVLKMFGGVGPSLTTKCANNSKPAGWVALVNSAPAITAAADCATKTQWTWGFLTAANPKSSLILAVSEEIQQAGAVGATPSYYSAGGTSNYATYGLGNWGAVAVLISYSGVQ